MHRLSSALAIAVLAFAGCASDSATEDGRDDSFTTDGKLDGFTATPAEAAAILGVVNSFSASKLKNDVGISTRAADNIVAVRLGDDETASTGDDEMFGSLAQLDAVPFIGPTAYQKLIDYVHANNLVGTTGMRQWQSETIVNGSVYNWTVDNAGKPVIVYRNATTAKIRLGDGTELDVPAAAVSGVPKIASDSAGTLHLFYRSGSGSAAVTQHVAYRNGQWVDHGTLSGDHFQIAQSPLGHMYALTAQTDSVFNNSHITATLVSLKDDGGSTSEVLWPVAFSSYKLDFEVGPEGYPSITYHRPGYSNPTASWQYAYRGPVGWMTTKIIDTGSGGNLVASTGSGSATVFLQLGRMTPFRRQATSFAAGASVQELNDYYNEALDAAMDKDGTGHACLVKSGNLIALQYDATGTMTTTPLGSAGTCSMHVDNAGTIHLLSSNGSVVNHWTY